MYNYLQLIRSTILSLKGKCRKSSRQKFHMVKLSQISENEFLLAVSPFLFVFSAASTVTTSSRIINLYCI